jgi:hypothetical protein
MGALQNYNIEINDDQKEALTDGVKFMLENPDITPKESHENWCRMKTRQGWVYGNVKDFEKKTHPDLVPYEDLPLIERGKATVGMVAQETAIKLWDELNENKDKSI